MAVVQKGLLFRGWSLKIAISIAKLGIVLGVVNRWPLFRGVVNTGLTVQKIMFLIDYFNDTFCILIFFSIYQK